MSHWNHRLFKQPDGFSGEWYSIREVHYKDNGEIYAYSAEADGIGGECVADIEEILEWMKNCLGKPIIELDENGDMKE